MIPSMRKARATLSEVSQSFLQSPYNRYWLSKFVVVLPDQPSSLFTLVSSGVGVLDESTGRSVGL